MLELPNEKKAGWRRRSMTYAINILGILFGALMPGLDAEIRKYIIGICFANLVLREKTQRKIKND